MNPKRLYLNKWAVIFLKELLSLEPSFIELETFSCFLSTLQETKLAGPTVSLLSQILKYKTYDQANQTLLSVWENIHHYMLSQFNAKMQEQGDGDMDEQVKVLSEVTINELYDFIQQRKVK